MSQARAVVIGAGIGGLVTAALLASRGMAITVVERCPGPGGKMLGLPIDGAMIDGGPTVFTMRWVFEDIFAALGTDLSAHVRLRPATILARHAWSASERLDLHAEFERSTEAIGLFAGADAARGYRSFCDRARQTFRMLDRSYIRTPKPTIGGLLSGGGPGGLRALWNAAPYTSLWRALGRHFADARLRQLFGRYSTYCGSSPFLAPATLMLIAHVEREGVWLVEGGMSRLADALAALAAARGVVFRFGSEAREIQITEGRVRRVVLREGEVLETDAVVVNGDSAALAAGEFGERARRASGVSAAGSRSLSAVTWALLAETEGFPLVRHNVFFSRDYAAEFDALFRRRTLPAEATVYVCAQDRDDRAAASGRERLLCLVNAPAFGDARVLDAEEIDRCTRRTFEFLNRCGLTIRRDSNATIVTTPSDFHRRYPATGGALYGRAVHGATSAFKRPTARTSIPNLYLAGGSIHPGPGVPMAALSGQFAAASIVADLTSTRSSPMAVMRGGMSTR